jgi:hypothetical protein
MVEFGVTYNYVFEAVASKLEKYYGNLETLKIIVKNYFNLIFNLKL